MKLLVIGIDGGTKRIIDNMPMPFTQELFSRSKSRVLEEDLISRGWAEILTGERSSVNKGFYLHPIEGMSYFFSRSYSQTEMLKTVPGKVLWERLNKADVSLGFLNVPTTGPACKVDGFFVAGGGGGLKVSRKLSPDMLFPFEYKNILDENDYIFDIRLPSGSKTVTEFLEKIIHAEESQKQTFVDLSRKEDPDFGFYCLRIATEVQYLAMYDIELCIKKIQQARRDENVYEGDTLVHKSLLRYYRHLDNCIQEVFERLGPENYIFLADHSTVLFEHDVNIDLWLENEGYLSKLSSTESRFYKMLYSTRKRIRKISSSLGLIEKLPTHRKPITKFHPKKTIAFGTFYETGNFAGIFINDRIRFDGNPCQQDEVDELVDEICGRFNESEFAAMWHLHAKPFRREFQGDCYEGLMPDIKIDKPDTIYFSGRRNKLIEKNPNLTPLLDDLAGITYPHTGLKGSEPLFVYSPDLEECIEDSDPNDLRVAYRMICRYFKA